MSQHGLLSEIMLQQSKNTDFCMQEKHRQKKVLITSPRAPVSIEWVRIMQGSGWNVSVVDSLDYPIGRFYPGVEYLKIPAPRLDFFGYKNKMLQHVRHCDLVIPTCEDILFLSLAVTGEERKKILMPDNDLLFTLHNKFDFRTFMNEHVKIPHTELVESKEQIRLDADTILKPVFSRFGRDVIRGVKKANIRMIQVSKQYPWVQQEYIHGEPLCNYAIIDHGRVVAHVVYRPKYLLNNAASTYFESTTDARCERFINKFAQDTKYHGQVAFDFIDDGKDLYVLECNPRATSGLHLIAGSIRFQEGKCVKISNQKEVFCRVGNSLYLLFGLRALFGGTFGTLTLDYQKAHDVLHDLPLKYQLLPFYEMIKKALWYRKPLSSATTFDIEYDGEDPQ